MFSSNERENMKYIQMKTNMSSFLLVYLTVLDILGILFCHILKNLYFLSGALLTLRSMREDTKEFHFHEAHSSRGIKRGEMRNRKQTSDHENTPI